MKRSIAVGAAAIVAITGLGPLASAAVIDTFDYSNSSRWTADGDLSGQFAGTVGPDGLIELAGVSAFAVAGFPSADLRFFSYDTGGGASTFGFIAVAGELTFCAGAPSVLDPRCNPGGANPPFARAVVLKNDAVIAYTFAQTTVTLVSSVVSTPEPSTWAMMLAGFAGLGLLGARRATKGGRASVARPPEGPAPPPCLRGRARAASRHALRFASSARAA